MESFTNAFISYGRPDSKAFARRLTQSLAKVGLKAWFDFDDIPFGVDYQKQINDGIEKADNFLFIISPHSINSEYCAIEIELALKLGKRIIPLLHVEEINKDTWQQRHPRGTDEQWEAYQAAGKHASFPNMHPEIAKINWVFCREGIDDFETSLQDLLAIFERQKDYVHSHTVLLTQALKWERAQKKIQHLLVGEARQKAETWLTTRFGTEQPPCTPTDLQCEFITESTKNANNLTTQVFIAYADEDRPQAEKIRFGLLHMGITLWSSRHDIETGQDFQQAINYGIEGADNIVFLISADSLQSAYCQHELDYALSLNKRVIPILCDATSEAQMPTHLQALQYIDISDRDNEASFSRANEQLLRVLHQDENYYRDHKNLLVKALKWQQQQQNASILLRGHDLRLAEAWLKTARCRELHPPSQLQTAYIEESLKQPPDAALDVFISYSRSDSECARKLNEALQKQGKKTWFDQESIAAGAANFEQEIYRGIEISDNFVFILSPQSIASPYCDREVEYAARLNKRFITVLHQPVDPKTLHPELAKVQWIDFRQSSSHFYTGFNQIVRVLESDRAHVQQHTHISLQAIKWEQKNQSSDLLLRGGELASAKDWLARTTQAQISPQPTALQKRYLESCEAAHQAAIRADQTRQRQLKALLGLMTAAFVGAVGTSVYALTQKNRAETSLEKQVHLLSSQARDSIQNGQEFDALLKATRASHLLQDVGSATSETQAVVAEALQNALSRVNVVNRIEAHTAEITDMAISPNSQHIATASFDGNAKLWSYDGRLIHTLSHTRGVEKAIFTPEGRHLITYDLSNRIRLWSVNEGEPQELGKHDSEIWDLDISPEGQEIAFGSKRGEIQIWNLDGSQLLSFSAHEKPVAGVRFSSDGSYLASWDTDQTVKLWNREGQLLHTLEHTLINDVILGPTGRALATRSKDGSVKVWSTTDTQNPVPLLEGKTSAFAFSPNGQRIATATSSGDIRIWQVQDGQLQAKSDQSLEKIPLSIQEDKINHIRFSADGKTLITAGADHSAKVWNLAGKKLYEFKHQAGVWEAMPSPDGRWIVSYDNHNLLRIWDLEQQPAAISLKGHTQTTKRAGFSSDGKTIGTASEDGKFYLWNHEGHRLGKITEEMAALKDFQFSSDGEYILTAGVDGMAKVFARDGQLLSQMPHENIVFQIQISPQQNLIATQEEGGQLNLWSFDGKLLATQKEQYSPVFSRDGQMLITASAEDVYLWKVGRQQPYLQEKCILKSNDSMGILRRLRLSEDGQSVLTTHEDGTARIWSFDCEQLYELPHAEAEVVVRDIVVSKDSQRFVTVGEDSIVKLWSADGQLLKTLKEHEDTVFEVKFNPDGKSFATAANDRTVKVWGLDGELLTTLLHSEEIQRFQYSNDGQQLLVAHGKMPTLWDLDAEIFDASLLLQAQEENQLKVSSVWPFTWGRSVLAPQATAPEAQLEDLTYRACQWLTPYLANQNEVEVELCLP